MHVAQQACSGVKHEFVVASQDIGSTSPSTHELLCEENELFFVHATSSTQPSCTTSSSPPEGKVQDGLAKDMLKGHERAILKEVLDCVTKTAALAKQRFGGAKGSVVMPPTDSQAVTLMSAKEASARSSAPGRMIKSANIVESTTVFNEKPCAVQTDRGGSYYSLEAALSARLRDMTNTVRDSPNALRRLLSA